jgi:hypothetical protein
MRALAFAAILLAPLSLAGCGGGDEGKTVVVTPPPAGATVVVPPSGNPRVCPAGTVC